MAPPEPDNKKIGRLKLTPCLSVPPTSEIPAFSGKETNESKEHN